MTATRGAGAMSDEHTRRMHLGPNELWTGRKRYACDGAVVAVTFERDPTSAADRVIGVVIEQLHDINVARHRTRGETREHLRRCLKLLTQEGMIITKDDAVHVVRPDAVAASPKLTLHAFHRPERARGPFAGGSNPNG